MIQLPPARTPRRPEDDLFFGVAIDSGQRAALRRQRTPVSGVLVGTGANSLSSVNENAQGSGKRKSCTMSCNGGQKSILPSQFAEVAVLARSDEVERGDEPGRWWRARSADQCSQ